MTRRSVAIAIPGDLDSTTGGYIYDRRLIAELRALGRDVMHIPLGGSFPHPSVADTGDAARRLAAVPADCPVLVDGLALGALDRRALRDMSAPIVALIHHPLAFETGLQPETRAHLLECERENLARASHVVVTSPHTATLLQSEYEVPAGHLTVARPGVDRRVHSGGGNRPLDPPLILSVGIQVRRKGHDILLRALARIRARPWQAVIAGAAQDPDCAASLATLAKELGLGDRVRFAGRISDAALAALYSDASIFALATRHEGHGLVFDEAMLHGLPIVSCRVGAVPDTVASGAGLLVAPDDSEALAVALARVLDDPRLAREMAKASELAWCGLPGWDTTGRIVEEVLARVDMTVAARSDG